MTRSQELYVRACKVIPGGVNSPVRAFRAVGGQPVFVAAPRGPPVGRRRQGVPRLRLELGPLHPRTRARRGRARRRRDRQVRHHLRRAHRARDRAGRGRAGGVPDLREGAPGVVGTEATMSALRLARGFTGRPKIIKADGGYHGHADFLLTAAGSGAATLASPARPVCPPAPPRTRSRCRTTTSRGRGPASSRAAGRWRRSSSSPWPATWAWSCRAPATSRAPGALRRARRAPRLRRGHHRLPRGLRRHAGALRRPARPHLLGQDPRRRAPLGGLRRPRRRDGQGRARRSRLPGRHPLGQPLAVAAGLKTLELLRKPGTYEKLERLAAHLGDGLVQATHHAGVPTYCARLGP